MIIQQVQSGKASSDKSTAIMGDSAEQFQSLLNRSKVDFTKADVDMDLNVIEDTSFALFNMEDLPIEMQDLLSDYGLTEENMLVELYNQFLQGDEQSFTTSSKMDAIPEKLWGFMDQIIDAVGKRETKDENSNNHAVDKNSITARWMESNPRLMGSTPVFAVEKTDESVLQTQFLSLVSQAQEVISKLNTKEDMIKSAPKILELLQQWQALTKSSNNKNVIQQQLFAISNESAELGIWKNVLETFQKREHFAGKQQYNTHSLVTVSDISKWIGNAIEVEKANLTNGQLHTQAPLSKLEQYSIYINQSQRTQTMPADQQLMEQFQKTINASKFSTLPNGTNQLSISLRPDNLGEMMVRFTQINGEMSVKILVTSAAAKEMLESNIHQLKNMFSPHQVVIEKQEASIQSASAQKERDNEQLKDQPGQQSESDQSNQKESNSSENSFERQFEELLMNEKV